MSPANQWRVPAPFAMAGITLFEDDIPYVPTGDYEVALIETNEWKKKGETNVSSIIFRLRIAEAGPEQGKATATWCGLNPGEGTARQWKAALISFGYKPEGLEANMQPDSSWFAVGKHAYIHIESPPRVEGKKITAEEVDVKFISPATYQKRKAEQKMAGVTGGNPPPAAAGFSPSSPPPGLPSAPQQASAPLAAPLPPGQQPGASLFGQPPAPSGPNGASAPPPPVAAGSAPPPMA